MDTTFQFYKSFGTGFYTTATSLARMPIEVCTIGGFSETGRNSTAVNVDGEVVILDMGLLMEQYIQHTEDREDISAKTYRELVRVRAVPDYSHIEDWKQNVIAIVPSHGHLDHAGAVPFAAPLFPQAPIICSPYTAELLRGICADERLQLPNKLIPVNLNSKYHISKNLTLELVYVTHSIPHASLVVLHTPYGKVVYANDYKFDRQPTLGQKPNFERLKEIGEEGVILLIVECLYAHEYKKTPSESVAQQMLKDVMLGVNAEKKAMIVTTFSSHLARLKSIIELGQRLDRKIVFLGRSLSKYVTAGENIGLIKFSDQVDLVRHRDHVAKVLKKADVHRDKYLLVVTGHQGEPRAMLSRMSRQELPFMFQTGDLVIFSCSIIPVEMNQKNREKLEAELIRQGVRVFRDIHVSGHAAREDHRDLLEMLRPKHILPAHAPPERAINIERLAKDLGYHQKNAVYVLEDGQRITLK